MNPGYFVLSFPLAISLIIQSVTGQPAQPYGPTYEQSGTVEQVSQEENKSSEAEGLTVSQQNHSDAQADQADVSGERGNTITGHETAPQELAEKLVTERWGAHEWKSFYTLAMKESGFQPGRLNKSSLACGIPQSLPCTNLYPDQTKGTIKATLVVRNGNWYLANPDWQKEVRWMVNYVADRYGTPTKALRFHNQVGWY